MFVSHAVAAGALALTLLLSFGPSSFAPQSASDTEEAGEPSVRGAIGLDPREGQQAARKTTGRDHDLVRGVTISTPGMGLDWGSDGMVKSLQEIRELGGNWVTIHPYASIGDGGRNRRAALEGEVRPWQDFDSKEELVHLLRPIREARGLGLKILIKPHLAYWGTRFRWRGEIDFESAESYARFFETYRRWILQLVEVCHEADAFAVGTELDLTLEHELQWREIIAQVRERTAAPLTYAANWPDYQRVPFWDALDVIGIQAYFPLTSEPSSDEKALRGAWKKQMAELRAFSLQRNRRIVFTELGYNRSREASVRPWEYRSEVGAESAKVQEACLRVALESIEQEPSVVGSFLWKWFPGETARPRNFNMQEPRILDLIRGVWKRND